MVVELIGPVVDDDGAVSRTIAETLTRAGLDLLPGALAQVAGMAPAHALRTLAEGHGRFELVEQLDQLAGRAAPALAAWAANGHARAAPGAVEAWRQLAAAGVERAMLTTIPVESASRLTTRLGITVDPGEWLVADDGRGLPHPDRLTAHLAGRFAATEVVALVQSVGAALGAAAAGFREVVAVGNGGARMFADREVANIGEFA